MDNELNLQNIVNYIFNLFKWICLVACAVSIIGLAITLNKDYPLLVNSTRSRGNIIGFEEKHLSTVGKLTAANAFSFNVAVVSFQDNNGITRRVVSKFGNTTSRLGDPVKVIYSNNNPNNAIIDQDIFHNWLTEYIWLFVLVFSYLGYNRFSKTSKIEK